MTSIKIDKAKFLQAIGIKQAKPSRNAKLLIQLIQQERLELNVAPFLRGNLELSKLYTKLRLAIPNINQADYLFEVEQLLDIKQIECSIICKFSCLCFVDKIIVLLPVNDSQNEPVWIDYIECLVVSEQVDTEIKLALINDKIEIFDFSDHEKEVLIDSLAQQSTVISGDNISEVTPKESTKIDVYSIENIPEMPI